VSILVVDVGTSGVRAAVVTPDGRVGPLTYREVLPDSPSMGLVEIDARALADAALAVATEALAAGGPVEAVGIANQRASTVVWDRATGEPVAPGIGWQDLRTVGTCLVLQAEGMRIAPNASGTKVAAILDMVDGGRERDLCFGTIDTWVAWTLSGGSLHVTDATNAGVTGMTLVDAAAWDPHALELLRVPEACLPRIVDSSGPIGELSALPGSPVLAGIAGDQQASLIGQSCVRPGQAKATFGTGGMLDCVTGERVGFHQRGGGGCFPIITSQRNGQTVWGVEAIMLSAGTCVEWLRDDMGLIESAADSETVARQCESSDGVWFVPAMLGLGTPRWDYGATGTLLGLTRGSGRPQIVRAVLEGIAHRGADLLASAEADAGVTIEALRVDGGMTANGVFTQALADTCGVPVEVSPEREATTLGAAYLAGLAIGTWGSDDDIAALWKPAEVVEPRPGGLDRARWERAIERSAGWVAELSALDF
jgi:glycerol kinase